jgi:hypothetical protein
MKEEAGKWEGKIGNEEETEYKLPLALASG